MVWSAVDILERHEEAVRFVLADAITQVKIMHPDENAAFFVAGAKVILEDALKLVEEAAKNFNKLVEELKIPERIEK